MSHQPTQLIDHLDAGLLGKGDPVMERRIHEDPETAQEWHYLQLAVEAVRDNGLYEQIGAVKRAWKAEREAASSARQDTAAAEESSGTVFRNLSRRGIQVAACLFVLGVGVGIFKYSTTSAGSLYDKNFSSFTLNSSRGAGQADALEQAYQNRQWAAVLSNFDATTEKTNKQYFLAGMANMELKQYDQAVEKFEQVLASNLQSGNDYFGDEAEFYLALSCLARHDVNEAIPLLDKIKANPQHLFHEKAMQISSLDLHIAQYKSSK